MAVDEIENIFVSLRILWFNHRFPARWQIKINICSLAYTYQWLVSLYHPSKRAVNLVYLYVKGYKTKKFFRNLQLQSKRYFIFGGLKRDLYNIFDKTVVK